MMSNKQKKAKEPGASQEDKQEAANEAMAGLPPELPESQEDKQREANERIADGTDGAPPAAEPQHAGQAEAAPEIQATPAGEAEALVTGAEADAAADVGLRGAGLAEKERSDAKNTGVDLATDQHAADGAGPLSARAQDVDHIPADGAGTYQHAMSNTALLRNSTSLGEAETAGSALQPDGGTGDAGDDAAAEPSGATQDDGEKDRFHELSPAIQAAVVAAAVVFGATAKPQLTTFDLQFIAAGLEGKHSTNALYDRGRLAADFLRENPDAPFAAVPIQLKMKGAGEIGALGPRELAAWKVFKATLSALDEAERAEKEATERRAATERAADSRPTVPAESAAWQPQAGGLDAAGMMPR